MTFLYISLDSFNRSYLIAPSDWDWWSSLIRRGLWNLCVVGRLGRKKKKARGEPWEGEREKRALAFSLFPSSPALFLFFDYCYIDRDTQREPMRRRELMEPYRVVPTFESVNDILWCDHSNGTYSVVLSHSDINWEFLPTGEFSHFKNGSYIKKWMDLNTCNNKAFTWLFCITQGMHVRKSYLFLSVSSKNSVVVCGSTRAENKTFIVNCTIVHFISLRHRTRVKRD